MPSLKFKLFLGFFIIYFTSLTFAIDSGLTFGQTTNSSTMPNATTNSIKGGNIFGVIFTGEIYRSFRYRSGFNYHERSYGNIVGATSYTYSFVYAEVPLGLIWQFNEYAGVFAGVNLGANFSSNCTPNACAGLNNAPASGQFGFQARMSSYFGGSLYFETSPAFVSTLDKESSFGLLLHLYFN